MGLDKIISTQEQVGGLQEQLTAMEPVLIKTQAEVEVMIVTIIQDKEEAGKTQRTVRCDFDAQCGSTNNTSYLFLHRAEKSVVFGTRNGRCCNYRKYPFQANSFGKRAKGLLV